MSDKPMTPDWSTEQRASAIVSDFDPETVPLTARELLYQRCVFALRAAEAAAYRRGWEAARGACAWLAKNWEPRPDDGLVYPDGDLAAGIAAVLRALPPEPPAGEATR